MRKIVFVLFILSIFVSSTFAEEIYTYKDKDGNTVISNTPLPEKYHNKAKKIETYDRESSEAIERYQEKQEEKRVLREEREYNHQERQSQKIPPQRKGIDASCKRECSVDLHTCQSDCSRHSSPYKSRYDTDNYERASCTHDCTTTYQNCVNGCYN